MFDVLRLVLSLFEIYYMFLVAGVLLSWMPMLYKFRIFQIIGTVGQWYMKPFNGIVIFGPFDFTPVFGFILYTGIYELIYYLLP